MSSSVLVVTGLASTEVSERVGGSASSGGAGIGKPRVVSDGGNGILRPSKLKAVIEGAVNANSIGLASKRLNTLETYKTVLSKVWSEDASLEQMTRLIVEGTVTDKTEDAEALDALEDPDDEDDEDESESSSPYGKAPLMGVGHGIIDCLDEEAEVRISRSDGDALLNLRGAMLPNTTVIPIDLRGEQKNQLVRGINTIEGLASVESVYIAKVGAMQASRHSTDRLDENVDKYFKSVGGPMELQSLDEAMKLIASASQPSSYTIAHKIMMVDGYAMIPHGAKEDQTRVTITNSGGRLMVRFKPMNEILDPGPDQRVPITFILDARKYISRKKPSAPKGKEREVVDEFADEDDKVKLYDQRVTQYTNGVSDIAYTSKSSVGIFMRVNGGVGVVPVKRERVIMDAEYRMNTWVGKVEKGVGFTKAGSPSDKVSLSRAAEIGRKFCEQLTMRCKQLHYIERRFSMYKILHYLVRAASPKEYRSALVMPMSSKFVLQSAEDVVTSEYATSQVSRISDFSFLGLTVLAAGIKVDGVVSSNVLPMKKIDIVLGMSIAQVGIGLSPNDVATSFRVATVSSSIMNGFGRQQVKESFGKLVKKDTIFDWLNLKVSDKAKLSILREDKTYQITVPICCHLSAKEGASDEFNALNISIQGGYFASVGPIVLEMIKAIDAMISPVPLFMALPGHVVVVVHKKASVSGRHEIVITECHSSSYTRSDVKQKGKSGSQSLALSQVVATASQSSSPTSSVVTLTEEEMESIKNFSSTGRGYHSVSRFRVYDTSGADATILAELNTNEFKGKDPEKWINDDSIKMAFKSMSRADSERVIESVKKIFGSG